jgi:HK97 family phage major capsid protein
VTYLEMLRARYEQARTAADALTTAAATANRVLTEDESTSLRAHVATCTELVPQIEQAAESAERDATVAGAFARAAVGEPANGAEGGERNAEGAEHEEGTEGAERAGQGGATTRQRDPGHYTRARDGRGVGGHSFFHDLVHAREDETARVRMAEHHRALSNASQGAGLVPPKWLTDEFELIARQGRVLAAAVRQYPLGDDPRPLTLPRQTAGTDSVITTVTPENTHPSEANGYNTAIDTVTPQPISGIQVVSRQMIDMDDPAIDGLIYSDMSAVYQTKIEALVTAAMITAAGTAVATYASDAANFTAAAAEDGITDAAFSVWNARKLPANVVAMRISRWGKFNKFRDTTGRRLYPTDESQIMNGSGRGSVTSPGSVGGLPVLLTDGLGTAGYAETILVARTADTILFEGNMVRFRYEEVAGPESVKLGIWAYAATIVRQNANSVRKLTITAA